MYAAKCEESLTQNRLYCPAPTCSTFIPPRSYAPVDERNTVAEIDGIRLQLSVISVDRDGIKPETKCPACSLVFCTGCRGEPHISPGENDVLPRCTRLDIHSDPKLERNLTKWGVKRWYVSSLPTIVIGFLAYMSLVINSPKCRCCVRLMSGCSHVRCQCQFEFCFKCLAEWNGTSLSNSKSPVPSSIRPPFAQVLETDRVSIHGIFPTTRFFFFNTPFSTYCYQDDGY